MQIYNIEILNSKFSNFDLIYSTIPVEIQNFTMHRIGLNSTKEFFIIGEHDVMAKNLSFGKIYCNKTSPNFARVYGQFTLLDTKFVDTFYRQFFYVSNSVVFQNLTFDKVPYYKNFDHTVISKIMLLKYVSNKSSENLSRTSKINMGKLI